MESFGRLPSPLCLPRKSPQDVARRKPLHRAASSAADEWKKRRSQYPQKKSSIGKKYQVSHIPEREEYYSASDRLYDLVYDPKNRPLVLLRILQKSSPETCLVDWTESQRKRFNVMMVRTMKNVPLVSKLLGNIGTEKVLDYYYGSYKGTPNYALLKETCPKHLEEDVLCGMCKRPGAIIACDNCTDAYHLECLTPPLKEIPTMDHFECNICIQERDNIDKSTGTKNATHHNTTQQSNKVATPLLSAVATSYHSVTPRFCATPTSNIEVDKIEQSMIIQDLERSYPGKEDVSENNDGDETSYSVKNRSFSCGIWQACDEIPDSITALLSKTLPESSPRSRKLSASFQQVSPVQYCCKICSTPITNKEPYIDITSKEHQNEQHITLHIRCAMYPPAEMCDLQLVTHRSCRNQYGRSLGNKMFASVQSYFPVNAASTTQYCKRKDVLLYFAANNAPVPTSPPAITKRQYENRRITSEKKNTKCIIEDRI